MIQLVIIGNGFDLAHNYPTKYSDFLFQYLKNSYQIAYDNRIGQYFEDELVRIQASLLRINPSSIKNFLKNDYVSIYFKNQFIKEIISSVSELNWADVEYLYYQSLLKTISANSNIKVNSLNDTFNSFKVKFISYLQTLKFDSWNKNIEAIISRIFFIDNIKTSQYIFLNFNYTNSLGCYLDKAKESNSNLNFQIIHIHGSLNDPSKIIFGYGDESDMNYKSIEDKNNNIYLNHFKSFHYIQSNNYATLFNILDMDTSWKVHVIGHSCGISDRILLKELFDNEKCKRITIYPYRKDDGTLDITEKVQQISRHFTGNSKHKMRQIITYDDRFII